MNESQLTSLLAEMLLSVFGKRYASCESKSLSLFSGLVNEIIEKTMSLI